MSKKVTFNESKNETRDTYNKEEYDRGTIDHVLYRKAYNRITQKEFQDIYFDLEKFKLFEMVVHKDSLL